MQCQTVGKPRYLYQLEEARLRCIIFCTTQISHLQSMSNIDQQWTWPFMVRTQDDTITVARRKLPNYVLALKVSAHWSYQRVQGVQTYHMQKKS